MREERGERGLQTPPRSASHMGGGLQPHVVLLGSAPSCSMGRVGTAVLGLLPSSRGICQWGPKSGFAWWEGVKCLQGCPLVPEAEAGQRGTANSALRCRDPVPEQGPSLSLLICVTVAATLLQHG